MSNLAKVLLMLSMTVVGVFTNAQEPNECTLPDGFVFAVGTDHSGDAITEEWDADDYIAIEMLKKKVCKKSMEIVELSQTKSGDFLNVTCSEEGRAGMELIPVNCL